MRDRAGGRAAGSSEVLRGSAIAPATAAAARLSGLARTSALPSCVLEVVRLLVLTARTVRDGAGRVHRDAHRQPGRATLRGIAEHAVSPRLRSFFTCREPGTTSAAWKRPCVPQDQAGALLDCGLWRSVQLLF